MLIEKILYRTRVKATAGRHIRAVSADGVMDLKLTMARELGGTSECGINPEQLFAASYAACFLGMMKLVAGCDGTTLPPDTTVEASVGVGMTPQGFGIEVELRICLPGLTRVEADSLVEQAHAACPYSNATRDNASVRLVLA